VDVDFLVNGIKRSQMLIVSLFILSTNSCILLGICSWSFSIIVAIIYLRRQHL